MQDSVVANAPLITNDATVLGVLALILGLVFYTSNSNNAACRSFYKYIPALLMCYLLPSLLNTFGIVSAEVSKVDDVAKYYLLPACLVLLTLSINIKAIAGLGSKAVIMFLTGTVGVIIGGPLALLIVSAIWPELIGVSGPDAVWRGMAALAGSWIGGGANMLAMKEIYGADGKIFTIMVTVDIVVANIWMAILLYMAANHKRIDAKNGADTSSIDRLIDKVEAESRENSKSPELKDYMLILAVAFGAAGLAHLAADYLVPLGGTRTPFTSELDYNIAVNHSMAVMSGMLDLKLTYSHKGDSNGDLFDSPLTYTPDQDYLDLYGNWTPNNGDYYVGFYVKNLEDSRNLAGSRTTSEMVGGPANLYFTQPRTAGLTFGLNF